MRLLAHLLKSYVQKGKLTIIDADGRQHTFGTGLDGPIVTAKIHDRKLYTKLLLNPELAVAEAYMDGTLTLEDGTTCNDFIDLFFVNPAPTGIYPFKDALSRLWRRIEKLQITKAISHTKKEVGSHYNLSTQLYELFLDEGLNYSCAYYKSEDDTLEQAQKAKLDHIVAKLDIKPGMTVLEIGGGWGALAMRMAEAGAQVTSLNISEEQIAIAKKRITERGLDDKISIVTKDYRLFKGKFDRVVSVGMMEHVGHDNLDGYFAKVKECLKPDGYAMIHSICRTGRPGSTGPFLEKYIFPGGYCPALSEVLDSIEPLDLWVSDMEILRLHYYYTLRDWRIRFMEKWDEVAEIYDERFCRMWEFYLCGCEATFKYGCMMVMQVMLALDRDSVPLTRDFIYDNERAMQAEADEASRKTA